MIRNTLKVLYKRRSLGLLVLLIMIAGGCASENKGSQEQRTAAFWPPYPDEPRLQFLVSYERSTDVQPKKTQFDQLIYGKEPEQVLPLNKPYGVKMWNGKIYVCDLRSNSITVLDLRGHRVLVMGKSGGDSLQTPTDIAIAPDGMKYVADLAKGNIAVYDSEDRRVSTFAQKDLKPVGLAVQGNQLYVCDFGTQTVQVLDRRTGSHIRTIGEPGGEAGQFVRPLGIAVDQQGFVYVMDVMKCQLQKFDPEGKYVLNFGTISSKAGGLVRPKQIDVDREGTIYVVDAAFQNVQLFDQMGHVLTFFGSAGTHPGAMYLPAGICVHEGDLDLFQGYIHPAFQAERLVVVTNQFGPNKVSVYAMGRLKAGKTVQDISATKGIVPPEESKTTGLVPTSVPADARETDESAPTTPAKPASAAPATK